MICYFDSSALVAAMVEEEAHHARAFRALAEENNGITSTHALGEVFATLTSGRLNIQLSANDAVQVIKINVTDRLQIIELSLSDYHQAMKHCQTVGARGGAFYEVLHLEAARRGKAQKIYTINVRHFQVFAPDLADKISLP